MSQTEIQVFCVAIIRSSSLLYNIPLPFTPRSRYLTVARLLGCSSLQHVSLHRPAGAHVPGFSLTPRSRACGSPALRGKPPCLLRHIEVSLFYGVKSISCLWNFFFLFLFSLIKSSLSSRRIKYSHSCDKEDATPVTPGFLCRYTTSCGRWST